MPDAPAAPPRRKIDATPLILITRTGEHRRKDAEGEVFISRRIEALALALVLATAVGVPALSFAMRDEWGVPPQDADGTFNMVGRVPEYGGWSQALIVVHLNDTVHIRVHSMDTVHGLGIAKFGVDSGPVEYGHPVVVEFTASAVGEFTISCTVRCAGAHSEMIATLRVVE